MYISNAKQHYLATTCTSVTKCFVVFILSYRLTDHPASFTFRPSYETLTFIPFVSGSQKLPLLHFILLKIETIHSNHIFSIGFKIHSFLYQQNGYLCIQRVSDQLICPGYFKSLCYNITNAYYLFHFSSGLSFSLGFNQ